MQIGVSFDRTNIGIKSYKEVQPQNSLSLSGPAMSKLGPTSGLIGASCLA
jgi:hypothetical protein